MDIVYEAIHFSNFSAIWTSQVSQRTYKLNSKYLTRYCRHGVTDILTTNGLESRYLKLIKYANISKPKLRQIISKTVKISRRLVII